MYSKIRKKKKGFTLVELIAVIAVIIVLMAILIPLLSKYIKDANDARGEASARAAYAAAAAWGANEVAKNGSVEVHGMTSVRVEAEQLKPYFGNVGEGVQITAYVYENGSVRYATYITKNGDIYTYPENFGN